MNINRSEVEKRTVPVSQYINELGNPFCEKILAAKHEYRMNEDAVKNLRNLDNDHFMVVFSAEWCKDCWIVIAALALISETTGFEVRVFGGLKKDALAYAFKWRVPPSPPEVNSYGVDKIPLVLIFNRMGEQIGRIVEKPKHMPTLEEEISEIMKHETPSSSASPTGKKQSPT